MDYFRSICTPAPPPADELEMLSLSEVEDLDNFELQQIHDQQQALLFRLPIELRLLIYEYVFSVRTVADDCVPLTHFRLRGGPQAANRIQSVLALLLTCRRTLAEAETIFYATNRLSLHLSSLVRMCRGIGKRRRAAITQLSIDFAWQRHAAGTMKALRLLPNLESLYLRRQTWQTRDLHQWAKISNDIAERLEEMPSLREIRIIRLRPHLEKKFDLDGGAMTIRRRHGLQDMTLIEEMDMRERHILTTVRRKIRERYPDVVADEDSTVDLSDHEEDWEDLDQH